MHVIGFGVGGDGRRSGLIGHSLMVTCRPSRLRGDNLARTIRAGSKDQSFVRGIGYIMTESERAAASRMTSAVARVLVGFLALTQVIIGVWALLAPASFYRSFPGAGQAWVSLLPPYNEHLITDVGELSLALAVVLGAAAITGQWLLSVVAIIAFAVYAVPHMIFHSLHLEGFSRGSAIAQTVGFAVQLLATAVVAWLLWRDRPRRSRSG